jgi:hypothetical protein
VDPIKSLPEVAALLFPGFVIRQPGLARLKYRFHSFFPSNMYVALFSLVLAALSIQQVVSSPLGRRTIDPTGMYNISLPTLFFLLDCF